MRVFVAIELEDSIRGELIRVQEILARRMPFGFRWTPPPSLHLTLQFLGEVEQSAVEGICIALAAVMTPRPPITVSLDGLGAFPTTEQPRVVWAGLSGEVAGLERLAADVKTVLLPLGFEPEERALHPHITLARAVRGPAAGKLAKVLQETAVTQISQQLTGFSLMESQKGEHGSIYSTISKFDLEGPAPAGPF